MKYKKLLLLILMASACTVGAQDTVRMTLDSCLRYAYGHNTTILNTT